MEIKGAPLPPSSSSNQTALAEKPAIATLAGFRVGQTLQAVVVKAVVNQTALLQVNNQQLRVETLAPLSVGQRLAVEVVQIEPRPILRLQALPPTTPISAEQVANAALKQALPRQTGLAPLLANLHFLSQSQQVSTTLAPLVLESIKKVIANLPKRSQVTTAEGLKAALKDSGLFLENKLASAPTNSTAGRDIKAILSQLMAQIRQAPQTGNQTTTPLGPQAAVTALSAVNAQVPPPPQRSARSQPQAQANPTLVGITSVLNVLGEIGKQTEGALARLLLHQLASLPQQDQNTALWMFELPVQHQGKTDLFQFTIQEEEREKDDQDQPRYSIFLSFDLAGLGPVHIKLSYARERIYATAWAEEQATASLLQQEMKELSHRFEKAGITVGHLRCQHGTPPEPAIRCVHQSVLDINV